MGFLPLQLRLAQFFQNIHCCNNYLYFSYYLTHNLFNIWCKIIPIRYLIIRRMKNFSTLLITFLLCLFCNSSFAQTFTCNGDLLFTRQYNPSPNSFLSKIDFSSGDINIVNPGSLTPAINTNASAWYNGYIWTQNYDATGTNNRFTLARVNAAYGYTNFFVSNSGSGTNMPANGNTYNNAGVSRGGIMYILQNGSYILHAIDLTGANPTYVTGYPKTLTGISEAAANVIWGDIAIDPKTDKVYCWYHPTTATAAVQRGLYEIRNITIATPTLAKVGANADLTMGTLFFNDRAQLFGYGSAAVGAGQNLFYAIDKDGGSAVQYGLSDSTVFQSDGASCPFRISLDRAVSTTILNIPRCGVDTFVYTFTPINFSNATATNVTFSDTLNTALSYIINTATLQSQLQAVYGAAVVVNLTSFGAGGVNNVLNITGLNISVGSFSFSARVRVEASKLAVPTNLLQSAWLKGIPTIIGGPNEPSNNPLTFNPKDATGIAINFNGNNCVPPTANNFENIPMQQGLAATTIAGLSAGDPDGDIVRYNLTKIPTTTQGEISVTCTPLLLGATCSGGVQKITPTVFSTYPSGVPLTPIQAATLLFDPAAGYNGIAEITFNVTDNVGYVSNDAIYAIPIQPVLPKSNNLMQANMPRTNGPTNLLALSGADIDGSINNFILNTIPSVSAGVLSVPCTTPFIGAGCSGGFQNITAAVLSNYPSGIPLTASQATGLRFDPEVTYTGLATFNYSCVDNSGNSSAVANFNIPVISTLTFDMPPLADNIEAPKLVNSYANVAIPKLAASDIAGTIATYKILTLPPATTGVLKMGCPGVPAGFTCVGSYANVVTNIDLTPAQAAKLFFDPSPNYIGTASFTYTATDAAAKVSNIATYSIPVANDKPTAVNVNTKIPFNALNVNLPSLGGTDKDGTVANFTLKTIPAASAGTLRVPCGPTPMGGTCTGGYVNLNSAVLAANSSGIPLTVAQGDALQFTGVASFSGTLSFSYFVTDNNGQKSNDAIYIAAVNNQAPIAYDVNNATLPNTNGASGISGLNSSDFDGNIVSFSIFSVPQLSSGVLTTTCNVVFTGTSCVAGRQVITPAVVANYPLGLPITLAQATGFQFDPFPSFTGVVNFTYQSIDNSGNLSNISNFNIPISGVGNIPPIANNIAVNAMSSNSPATAISSLGGLDVDGTLSNYNVLTLPSIFQGTVSTNCSVVFTGGTCTGGRQNLTQTVLNNYPNGIPLTIAQSAALQFDPEPDFSGIAMFTYNNTDNFALTSNIALYTIPVLNLQPVAYPIIGASRLSTASAAAIPSLKSIDYDGSIKGYFLETLPALSQGVLLVPCTPAIVGATCSGGYQTLTPSVLANYPNNDIPLTIAQMGNMQFDPTSGYIGDVIFNYHGMDNGGNFSNSTTYSIPVNGYNPATNDVIMPTMAHNSPTTAINAINATDIDGTVAYYVLSSVPLPNQGVLSIPCTPLPTGATCTGGFADITQAVLNTNGGNITLTASQATGLRFDPTTGFRGNAIFNFAAYDNFNTISNHATYVIPVDNFTVLNNPSVKLQATFSNNQINASWQASNTQAVSNFIVEYSTDNSSFISTPAILPNTQITSYTQQIKNTLLPVYFVRVKIVALNGTVSYSNTVKVQNTKNITAVLAPNPTTTTAKLFLNATENGTAVIEIFNAAGQLINKTNYSIFSGNNNINLTTLSNQSAGKYSIRITTNTNSFILLLLKL
jgi:uncharacterized repeat protein (TIGR01451 family)